MKKRDSNQTRKNILDAAEYEFSEKGIYGTRIDEIAERANINKRMIYEYFGNKEELYRTVLFAVYQRLGEQELTVLSENVSCVEAIKRIIRFYFEYLEQNPTYVNLLLWENLNKGRYIQNHETSVFRNSTFEALRNIIKKGKEQGVFRESIDTEQFIVSLLMYTFSHFSNKYTLAKLMNQSEEEAKNKNKTIDTLTQMFIRYMCTYEAFNEGEKYEDRDSRN